MKCETYDEFFAAGAGVGAYMWSELGSGIKDDEERHLVLYLKVPSDNGPPPINRQGYVILCLYVSRESDNWAKPGPVKAWDGNREKPTLSPSIQVNFGDGLMGWHGFLINGELRTDGLGPEEYKVFNRNRDEYWGET